MSTTTTKLPTEILTMFFPDASAPGGYRRSYPKAVPAGVPVVGSFTEWDRSIPWPHGVVIRSKIG